VGIENLQGGGFGFSGVGTVAKGADVRASAMVRAFPQPGGARIARVQGRRSRQQAEIGGGLIDKQGLAEFRMRVLARGEKTLPQGNKGLYIPEEQRAPVAEGVEVVIRAEAGQSGGGKFDGPSLVGDQDVVHQFLRSNRLQAERVADGLGDEILGRDHPRRDMAARAQERVVQVGEHLVVGNLQEGTVAGIFRVNSGPAALDAVAAQRSVVDADAV
jgi:hypothetical protein